jgi:hypothetical protein
MYLRVYVYMCIPEGLEHLLGFFRPGVPVPEEGLGFRVWGSGFGVQGSGFRVQGLGLRYT